MPTLSKTVFIVRHGERQDHVDKTWQSDPSDGIRDPPLSEKGEQQSQKTGAYLIDLLREKDIKLENTTVVFVCSPFQRCIDTAVGIARGLQHAKQTFLRLEPAAGEWMTERFFDEVECTAQQMTQRKIQDIARNHAQISKVLSMDWHYTPIRSEFVYPETRIEMEERFDEMRRSLDTMIARDVKANRIGMVQQDMKRRDIVIVLVTHAAGINALLESYKQESTLLETPYCCVSRVRYKQSMANDSDSGEEEVATNGQWVVDMQVSSKHLKGTSLA
ncbi:hypothetical protein Unana1_06456 [Umbelopsis nana]